MAMKNVVGLFDTMQDAEAVVRELHAAGVAQADISFAGRSTDDAIMESNEYISEGHSEAAEGAGFGATGGTVVGGLTGLLVGLGALAIPGVGPVIAAGSLATALGSAALGAGIGAATGGLLGALIGAGIPEEDANVYSEGIRRGGALVMAKVDDSLVDTALDVMERHNVVDIDERGTQYRQSGWSRFDDTDSAYASATAGALGAGTTASVDDERTYGTTTPDTTYSGSTSSDTTYNDTGDVDNVPGRDDYERSSKVGTAGGAVAGAATGAAIGSAGGPIGTVVGGVAGAVTGGGVGAAGDAAGVEATDSDRSSASYDTGATSGGVADNTTTSTGGTAYGSATDYGSSSSTMGSTHRSRSYDVNDAPMGERLVGGEGAIENTAARIENATERGINTDLDRDGDVGMHDKRDNY